jgi:hypothetical protein
MYATRQMTRYFFSTMLYVLPDINTFADTLKYLLISPKDVFRCFLPIFQGYKLDHWYIFTLLRQSLHNVPRVWIHPVKHLTSHIMFAEAKKNHPARLCHENWQSGMGEACTALAVRYAPVCRRKRKRRLVPLIRFRTTVNLWYLSLGRNDSTTVFMMSARTKWVFMCRSGSPANSAQNDTP